jgi:AhpD family alkylhydroperoxidase
MNEFENERERLNKQVLDNANLTIKRFFALDTATYADGALDAKTKEMLGLAVSLALRCDDCVRYHLGKCRQEKLSNAELQEVLSVALVVGGSIVIPHLRRAVDYWLSLTTS